MTDMIAPLKLSTPQQQVIRWLGSGATLFVRQGKDWMECSLISAEGNDITPKNFAAMVTRLIHKGAIRFAQGLPSEARYEPTEEGLLAAGCSA